MILFPSASAWTGVMGTASAEQQVPVAVPRVTKPEGRTGGGTADSSATLGPEMYGDVCTISIQKPNADSRCGVKLGETRDGIWVIVGAVERGSLADRFPDFKSGARITSIRGGGEAYSPPTLRQAATLLASATGNIDISFKPLFDRLGFICAVDEFAARIETRDQVRQASGQASGAPWAYRRPHAASAQVEMAARTPPWTAAGAPEE
jgi:hypothetical protein